MHRPAVCAHAGIGSDVVVLNRSTSIAIHSQTTDSRIGIARIMHRELSPEIRVHIGVHDLALIIGKRIANRRHDVIRALDGTHSPRTE
jgi:hypothetical protein